MMSKQSRLFQVSNRHGVNCGIAPQIDGDDHQNYYGYFENEHGEQAVFVYNRKTRKATVRLGDAGWENEYEVIDGQAESLALSEEEKLWLSACWRAATAFDKK